MTEARALLTLATKLYPDREWFDDTGMCWQTSAERTGYALSGFDPLNNNDQFVAMQIWLHTIGEIEIAKYTETISRFVLYPYNDSVTSDPVSGFDFDGTEAGFRVAVLAVALRLVK